MTSRPADVVTMASPENWSFTFWGWRRDAGNDAGAIGYDLVPVLTIYSNLIEFIDWAQPAPRG